MSKDIYNVSFEDVQERATPNYNIHRAPGKYIVIVLKSLCSVMLRVDDNPYGWIRALEWMEAENATDEEIAKLPPEDNEALAFIADNYRTLVESMLRHLESQAGLMPMHREMVKNLEEMSEALGVQAYADSLTAARRSGIIERIYRETERKQ